ncbi:hypothetical protein ONZ43_g6204 [Nemania bipapillata]|uniref:Uncharacterized protein n=1 Tax=Nemania bipapillata TaxID=110536 RepID=A0ACC2I2I3_9PEZI|nr:hypothetical protein ONZ43_g6204 [Nemania bipapillata]
MSQTVSVDSRMHSRLPSDASELEGRVVVAELSSSENNEAEPRRRSNSITRPTNTHVRRNSDLSGQNRARGDSSAGAGPLRTVNELYELHGNIPGHYGPEHAVVGQTLDRGPSPASSGSSRREAP